MRSRSCTTTAAFLSIALIALSQVSGPRVTYSLPLEHPFLRGDINEDGQTDFNDVILTFRGIFIDLTLIEDCPDKADINDDGKLDIVDGIYYQNFVFVGGPPPAAPWPDCGIDSTADSLGPCQVHDACQ